MKEKRRRRTVGQWQLPSALQKKTRETRALTVRQMDMSIKKEQVLMFGKSSEARKTRMDHSCRINGSGFDSG